jgi:hypothetical protein
MRADVLPGRDSRTGGRWRAGLRLADTAERETAERRQRAGTETGALQESPSIQIAT